MKNIILLLTLIAIQSCMTTVQKLNPTVYYKNDLKFEYKDIKFTGVGLLPVRDEYEIEMKGYGKLNSVELHTCHREITMENPDNGIFRRNGKTIIKFLPSNIEKNFKYCPMYVTHYNVDGKHAFGIIFFNKPDLNLRGTIECNGKPPQAVLGKAICESKDGLYQKIWFDEPVKISKPTNGNSGRKLPCDELNRQDEKTFLFKISNRECNYKITGLTTGKILTLHTIGHEDIPNRVY